MSHPSFAYFFVVEGKNPHYLELVWLPCLYILSVISPPGPGIFCSLLLVLQEHIGKTWILTWPLPEVKTVLRQLLWQCNGANKVTIVEEVPFSCSQAVANWFSQLFVWKTGSLDLANWSFGLGSVELYLFRSILDLCCVVFRSVRFESNWDMWYFILFWL